MDEFLALTTPLHSGGEACQSSEVYTLPMLVPHLPQKQRPRHRLSTLRQPHGGSTTLSAVRDLNSEALGWPRQMTTGYSNLNLKCNAIISIQGCPKYCMRHAGTTRLHVVHLKLKCNQTFYLLNLRTPVLGHHLLVLSESMRNWSPRPHAFFCQDAHRPHLQPLATGQSQSRCSQTNLDPIGSVPGLLPAHRPGLSPGC